MTLQTIHVVLGDKPDLDADGKVAMSLPHKQRVDKAIAGMKPGDVLILTGGVTVGREVSEGRLAEAYVQSLVDVKDYEVVLEDRSITTAENIAFSAIEIARRPDLPVVVYCDSTRRLKILILARHFWRREITPVVCNPRGSWVKYLLQVVIAAPIAFIDPEERHVARVLRKF